MESRQSRPSRNESAEGSSRARSRWFAYLGTLEPELLDISGALEPSLFRRPGIKIDEADRKAWARQVSEFSEMIGFWVAWHSAGGFDQLENQGWHRATIYRKLKRFKERFNAHPDDYDFPWISLDLHKLWTDELYEMLEPPQVEITGSELVED